MMIAPEARSVSTAASMAARCSLLVATHGKSASKPRRGGRSSPAIVAAIALSPARALASTAQSSTFRAKTPKVSSDGLNSLTPPKGNASRLGLNPTTPQYAAGRMTEPLVWVPIAAGTCPNATAAADPEDDPPGVCAAFQGFLVFPGCMNANSVVTGLPITRPPARLRRSTH